MVETIRTCDHRTEAEAAFGVPVIQIHHIRRDVHGNSIAIKVYGEMKIASQERVFARELKLNTLQVLNLTYESGSKYPRFNVHKNIHNKGEYDNYASIHVWDLTNDADATPGYQYNPADGSIWLNFIAVGE